MFYSMFYYIQNLVVHWVALTFGDHTMDIELKSLVQCHSFLDKYWLELFDSTKITQVFFLNYKNR